MWTSFVLRSTLRTFHKNTYTYKHLQSGTSHCCHIIWTYFFQRCPHWFCTQNKTGDSTPTGDYCPSIVKIPGLNAYTNAHVPTHPHPYGSGLCGTTIALLLYFFFRISLVGYTETKRNFLRTIVPVTSQYPTSGPLCPHAHRFVYVPYVVGLIDRNDS